MLSCRQPDAVCGADPMGIGEAGRNVKRRYPLLLRFATGAVLIQRELRSVQLFSFMIFRRKLRNLQDAAATVRTAAAAGCCGQAKVSNTE